MTALGALVYTALLLAALIAAAAQPATPVRVEVRGEDGPVAGAAVTLGAASAVTDAQGVALLVASPGPARLTVTLDGFLPFAQDVTVGAETPAIIVDLHEAIEVEEEVVVVATTRTGRRLEDQPTRVEVLDREEIEEKLLMTPGDIVMMLNEMGGLRVQATSPSIGAASVRVQGMQGRYTRFLSDGLPLFGQQVGGLGLLQIPPMDLGQVEVIKGVASALLRRRRDGRRRQPAVAAAGRRAGVRRAGQPVDARRDRRGGVPVGAARERLERCRCSAAAIASRATTATTTAGPTWPATCAASCGRGSSGTAATDALGFATAGLTVEERDGGTLPGGVLAATGAPYTESLDTTRGATPAARADAAGERFVLTARGGRRLAAARPPLRPSPRARSPTTPPSARWRCAGRPAATPGSPAWPSSVTSIDPRDVPRFAYTYVVPGVFVQDDIDVASWLSRVGRRTRGSSTASTARSSARVWRRWCAAAAGPAASRVGQGFFAATPLTEETEAAGLTRLEIPVPLKAERGTSASLDVTRALGPATVTATVFGSRIADPVGVDRDDRFALFTRSDATTNVGVELLGTVRRGAVRGDRQLHLRARRARSRTASGATCRSRPGTAPGSSACGRSKDAGRVGLELYYTGEQRLEENPYRHGVAALRDGRPAGREALRAGARVPERREPDGRAPDPLGLAAAAVAGRRRALDGGRVGAARRPRVQRRRARRLLIDRRWLADPYRVAGLDLVGAARRHQVAGAQIAEDLDQRAGGEPGADVDPLGLAVAHADDEGAVGGRGDAAARHEERRRRRAGPASAPGRTCPGRAGRRRWRRRARPPWSASPTSTARAMRATVPVNVCPGYAATANGIAAPVSTAAV